MSVQQSAFLFDYGCPECDAAPAAEIESDELFATYSATEGEGVTRCQECKTVFDVGTGEVLR